MNLNKSIMNNKSSIQWLISCITEDQMVKAKSLNEWLEVFEQAKAMHKEEVKESYREGRSDQQSARNQSFYHRNSEQYYNETFGGNNE